MCAEESAACMHAIWYVRTVKMRELVYLSQASGINLSNFRNFHLNFDTNCQNKNHLKTALHISYAAMYEYNLNWHLSPS